MPNPIKLLRIYSRAQRLYDMFERATTDWESRKRTGGDMSKSIFRSKTFWFNFVAGAVELSGVLPLPPGTTALIAAVGNILLRRLTSEPVHVVSSRPTT